MSKSMTAYVVSPIVALALSGCTFAENSPLRRECRPWLDTFFEKPLQERISTFPSYDHEDQFQIYLCGNQVVHPPAIYLAEPFASEGTSVVHLLKQQLAQTSQDLTIRDIVMVFAEMERQRTYDVSADGDLMELMARRVDGMSDEDWKRITRDKLSEIAGSR